MVKNVDETIKYYENVLGFKLVMIVPNTGKHNWAMMKRGNVEIMFQEESNLIEEYPILANRTSAGGLTFYIRVEDIVGLHNEIKKKVNVVLNLHRTFYGTREFAIIDINGFIITFSS